MYQGISKTTLSLLFVLTLVSIGSGPLSAQTKGLPRIHVNKTHHSFPPVFEGEELSHSFTVHNLGTAALHIKKVTHS